MSEKTFTQNWFAPQIIEPHLKYLKNVENARFLEIGTFEGRSACWMLDNYKCTLVTIDPCVLYPVVGHEYINESMYPLLVKNLEPYGERVKFFKDYSENVLPTLKPESFDFIYIDGDHRYAAVLKDANLSWPLLKHGGVMAFDDYSWNYDPHAESNPESPHDAIDLFMVEHANEFFVLAKGYHVILRKK